MPYDLAIIGGGPAGVAAGVYAARKRLKTLFITKDFEGQSFVSLEIQNWIGDPTISGEELARKLENHLKAYADDIVDIKTHQLVISVKKIDHPEGGVKTLFEISTKKETFTARTVLLTAGSRRRALEVPGAAQFDNKGLTYCASCDGPLFKGMDVVVVGGGNAGFDTAAQLLAYCHSVLLLSRNEFKADETTVEQTLKNPAFKAIANTDIVEIKGDTFVNSIVYKNRDTGEVIEQPTKGIFAEIGSIPNTDFVKGLVKLDPYNHIITDPKDQKTSEPGIWAAGDITDGLYHQNNIAAGDAIKALEDIYLFLHKTR
jgi:alkyl hydroperoxide reductase subunit F